MSTAIGAIIGALVTLIVGVLALPRIRAEARKLNAEASRTEWQTLRDEIDHLQERAEGQDERIAKQDGRIAELEQSAVIREERASVFARENKSLRTEVGRLRKRVEELEAIFKIGPITPEMQAELDKLDKLP